MNLDSGGYSIGDLAQRTGVQVSTLRAWERRHGFPLPERLAGGHRRYSERDVQGVIEVVRQRNDGTSLHDALRNVLAQATAPRASITATLRRAIPEVSPALMSRASMIAISHAIEDEAAGRVDRPIFLGSFQAEHFWQRTRPRWHDLSVSSQVTIALAAAPRARHHARLWEVPLPPSSPVAREWTVICDAPGLSACLVGAERPGGRTTPASARSFEVLWTTEPVAVREAARTAAAIAIDGAPALAGELTRLREPAQTSWEGLRSSTVLTNRILAYLESSGHGSGRTNLDAKVAKLGHRVES